MMWRREGLGVRVRVAWQSQSQSPISNAFAVSRLLSPSPQHAHIHISTPQPNHNNHAVPLDCFGALQHHARGDGVRAACDRAVHARGGCCKKRGRGGGTTTNCNTPHQQLDPSECKLLDKPSLIARLLMHGSVPLTEEGEITPPPPP